MIGDIPPAPFGAHFPGAEECHFKQHFLAQCICVCKVSWCAPWPQSWDWDSCLKGRRKASVYLLTSTDLAIFLQWWSHSHIPHSTSGNLRAQWFIVVYVWWSILPHLMKTIVAYSDKTRLSSGDTSSSSSLSPLLPPLLYPSLPLPFLHLSLSFIFPLLFLTPPLYSDSLSGWCLCLPVVRSPDTLQCWSVVPHVQPL